jgi:hypothetical protein
MMYAERVSRSMEGEVRAEALAEAARCLLLLERDLAQAEAFVLEASALAERSGQSANSVRCAAGMLHLHRGNHDAACEALREARRLARSEGDRRAEFSALEHLVMLEIERDAPDRAERAAEALVGLADRLPPGSEEPFARGLLSLARWGRGHDEALRELRDAAARLRIADAKYRSSYLLTRWAERALARGDHEGAGELAAEAAGLADAIARPTEMALARVLLARAAAGRGDGEAAQGHQEALRGLLDRDLAARVRSLVDAELAGAGERPRA